MTRTSRDRREKEKQKKSYSVANKNLVRGY